MKKANTIFDHTDCLSEEMLTKYVSNDLSPAEKHEVEKHLLDCEMCSDAVEGLAMISDKSKISKITSGLNQKIGERVAKSRLSGDPSVGGKEGKVIFLQQYRSQLAIAASVVVLLGLVLFFRYNMGPSEMDQESSNQIFAEKFEAPPADLEEIEMEEAEKSMEDKEMSHLQEPVSAAAEEPLGNVADEQDIPANFKSGKDAGATGEGFARAEGNKVAATEELPAQKTEKAKLKALDLADDRSKNLDVTTKSNSNATVTSDIKTREDNLSVSGKKDLAENRNELESLKEKDKKGELAPKAVPVTTTASGGVVSGSYSMSPPVTDKTVLAKQQSSNKLVEEAKKAEEKQLAKEANEQEQVLAFEVTESRKKSEGRNYKKAKESKPQKPADGNVAAETTVAAPVPEAQAKITQTENGAKMDTTAQFYNVVVTDALGSQDQISDLDGAMVKYDKEDYAGAVTDFETTLKQNPKDEKALFYSAVSYLSLGQTERAVTNLNKVLENKTGTYYDSAQWYLSLAYIKNNDTKNARKNLMELQKNSKSRYQKQADETLKQMQK